MGVHTRCIPSLPEDSKSPIPGHHHIHHAYITQNITTRPAASKERFCSIVRVGTDIQYTYMKREKREEKKG
jgi:hypothetical protein